MLVAGLALIVLGVHEIKAIVDRPRPAAALIGSRGSSFPSGHAAYSTFYVWLAVTIVVRLRPGMARGAAVDRRRHRAHRPGRPLARLPRRPLPQRRQRRLGARAPPPSPSARPSRWSSPRCGTMGPTCCRWRCRRSKMSTCCSARAGLVTLVAFVGLILVPGARRLRPALGEGGRRGALADRPRGPRHGRGRDRSGDRLLLPRHRQALPLARTGPRRFAGRDNGPMPATSKGEKSPANTAEPGTLDALAEAVESGAGLPAVARAAARVLDASVALIDRSSAVLAVAGASPDQEKKLLAGGERRDDGRAARRRRRGRRAALPRPGGARPGDRPHGDDPAGARAGALRARRSGRARRWPAPSSPRCSPARSPTAATSSPAPPSWAPTSRGAPG